MLFNYVRYTISAIKDYRRILIYLIVSGCIFSCDKKKENTLEADNIQKLGLLSNISKDSKWKHIKSIKLNFEVYHTQGLVKINNEFFLSTVEVIEKPDKNKYSSGTGKGHLIKFDLSGNKLGEIIFDSNNQYHSSGIDYDGEFIWISLSEYRPSSNSTIYKINPKTLKYKKVFSVQDHIGSIFHNYNKNLLYGINWGTKIFYTWNLKGELVKKTNYNNHYISYQDCHYLADNKVICGGTNFFPKTAIGTIAYGGLDIIDLENISPVKQTPVIVFTPDTKMTVTRNPFWVDVKNKYLIFYFIPEPDNNTLYLYELNN